MHTSRQELTPDGMRKAFAECVGSYDNLTEDDICQLSYMVGAELIRSNRSLPAARVKLDGSYLGGCSVYAPGGRVEYAAITVRFSHVAAPRAAILFSSDGTVMFGSGMELESGMAFMLPVFRAFDEWARELHEFRVRRALGVPDGAALRSLRGPRSSCGTRPGAYKAQRTRCTTWRRTNSEACSAGATRRS